MSKPQLSIELADPDRVYQGGDTIKGVVRVHAQGDIACKGLVIQSVWRTHGRGNVASGEGEVTTAFTGQWRAGEKQEYPFELKVADWPPSYHGHYLNVDHYVETRAKIAWAFDPKTAVPFLMRPISGPQDESAESSTGSRAVIAIFAVFFAITFGGIFIAVAGSVMGMGWMALVMAIVPMAGLGYWFIRKWMPKYLLGEVTCHLTEPHLAAGDHLKSELVITPRRSVSINGITLKVTAREQVVSGSGSNKTTHRHEFFDQEQNLTDATTLKPEETVRIPIDFPLPQDAPPSLDLPSNQLIWEATLRIDIPRWPDWVKNLRFTVVPSRQSAVEQPQPSTVQQAAQQSHSRPASSAGTGSAGTGAGITWNETVEHLWQARGDRQQREMLIEAVTGMTFPVTAIIERRLLYGGDHDPNIYPDGHSVWARVPDPEFPLVLFVPHDMGDEFEQLGRQTWNGRATVVGWDDDHQRLQLAMET